MTAPSPTIEEQEETEAVRVLRWRLSQLRAAGYPWEEAIELAVHGDIDIHSASFLVSRGCPSATAVRILL